MFAEIRLPPLFMTRPLYVRIHWYRFRIQDWMWERIFLESR